LTLTTLFASACYKGWAGEALSTEAKRRLKIE